MNTTTTEFLDTPLGELVAADGRRAELFDRLGLDYCCAGDRTLREACREEEVDPAPVVAALEAFGGTGPPEASGVDWRERSLAELIDHIVDEHHAYLRRELPGLSALVDRVVRVHGGDHPWLHELGDVFDRLRREIDAHTEKEEEVLFPMIRTLESGDRSAAPEAEALLAEAEHEHEVAGDALRRLRTLSDDFTPPEGACGSFRRLLEGLEALESDMHRHVHEENGILFPRARRLVGDGAPAPG